MDDQHQPHEERRKYLRIKKNFILTYCEADNPHVQYDITQVKNLSKGGMCFVTNRPYVTGTKLKIQLKTPFVSDTTRLIGTVLESHTKVRKVIYETRVKFGELTGDAAMVLEKIEQHDKEGSL